MSKEQSKIEGTVKESSGGTLPGVTLSLSSDELAEDRVSVSNHAGEFLFDLLPPGTYTINAKLTGFNDTMERLNIGIAQTIKPTLFMTPNHYK